MDKAITNGQKFHVVVFSDSDFTSTDLCHQRNVLRQDTHLAFLAGKRDHADFLRIDGALRSDDFKFERLSHKQGVLRAFQRASAIPF